MIQQLKKENLEGTAINEILTDDGYIYTTDSKKEAVQKEDPFNSLYEMVIKLSHSKKNNRQMLLKEIADKTLNVIREKNKISFSRSTLKVIVRKLNSDRTKRQITKELINFLISNKLIERLEIDKTINYLENRELKSSAESYNIDVMQKNGYKRFWILQDGKKKVKIDKRNVGELINIYNLLDKSYLIKMNGTLKPINNYDDDKLYSEIKSFKPYKNQKVKSLNRFSVVLNKKVIKQEVFFINE